MFFAYRYSLASGYLSLQSCTAHTPHPMPEATQSLLTPDTCPQQQPIFGAHLYSPAAALTSDYNTLLQSSLLSGAFLLLWKTPWLKTTWRGKELFQPTLLGYGQSPREIGSETQGNNLETGTEAEHMEEPCYCLLSRDSPSPSFFIQSRVPVTRDGTTRCGLDPLISIVS